MFLRSVDIRNFRSLEHVRLDGLDRFNVLIGRNNAGKSSVFGALAFLSSAAFQISGLPAVQGNVLTDRDLARSFRIDLVFAPRPEDRQAFVGLLCGAGYSDELRDSLLDSPLVRQVAFKFASAAGNPSQIHLRETSIQSADGNMAVTQHVIQGDPSGRMSVIPNIDAWIQSNPTMRLDADAVAVTSPMGGITETTFSLDLGSMLPLQGSASTWPQGRLARWIADAFFFSPF